MGLATSKAPSSRPKLERRLLIVRILQLLIDVAYVVTIGLTSADSGRWTYGSIEAAAALGGKQMIPTPSVIGPSTTDDAVELEQSVTFGASIVRQS
ncbi:MAG: hypothetical protein Q9213_001647 [Squamulea squamosa]